MIAYLKKRTKKKIKRRIAGLKRCTKRIERHLESLQSTIKALSDQLGQLRFERPGGVKDCEQSVEQLLSFNPTTPEQQQQQQQQGQHESMEQLNSFGRDMATFHDLDFNIPTFLGSGMLN